MANIKFTNFAHSLLAVGIGPGDTSISVTGGHGVRFPALGAGEYFYATLEDASNNREIVKVTARASDVLTVVRAQDNTSALSWNAGDTIALRLNAAAITDFVDTVVNTVAKTSSTGSAVVPSGTVAQRDGSPVDGYFRYNADNDEFEGYATAWVTMLDSSMLGVSVQAYDADTAKTDTAQNFTAPQRSAILTDNDGSFDLSAKQNFKCTTAGSVTLTFTNQADGLSGSVIFINSSNHTVSAHANTKLTAADLAKLSVTGTYRIDYLSDGTNAYCSVTGAFA